MNDELELLFEVVEEDMADDGVLAITATALPRFREREEMEKGVLPRGSAPAEALWTEEHLGGAFDQLAEMDGAGVLLADERKNISGRFFRDGMASEGNVTLFGRMVAGERMAQRARNMNQSEDYKSNEMRTSVDGMVAKREESIRSIDRAMERDARRYDGGFLFE